MEDYNDEIMTEEDQVTEPEYDSEETAQTESHKGRKALVITGVITGVVATVFAGRKLIKTAIAKHKAKKGQSAEPAEEAVEVVDAEVEAPVEPATK